MISSKGVKRAIRQELRPRIYSRGLDYFHSGRVKKWSTEENKADNSLVITGKVRGGKTYKVTLEFDTINETLIGTECNCPYESTCKHVAALGLAFADSLVEDQISKTPADILDLRQALQKFGIATQNVPPDLITQLMSYRQPKVEAKPAQRTLPFLKPMPRPFNPRDYFITLGTYNGYVPAFFEAGRAYEQASIRKVLSRNDLTGPQRELLTYIKDSQSGHFGSPPPDPEKLFPLLVDSGFDVYDGFYSYPEHKLVIDTNPNPLQAEIIYEPEHYGDDETKTRHDFFLRVPEIYWKDKDVWYEKPFFISGSCLVYENGRRLELHRLTKLLVGAFTRLEPVLDYTFIGKKQRAKYHQAGLTGEDLTHFDQLIKDASSLLSLTSQPPPFKSEVIQSEARPAILVDYNSDAQTLRVTPVMDYKIYKQDVSESVYVSRRINGDVLNYRPTFENPGTHIITVNNSFISCAKVAKQKEIEFYREMSGQAQKLGFTKTLKCLRRGEKPLLEYHLTFWPTLMAYAQEKGYPILFQKDELAQGRAEFRADFTADINTGNDWLYFDVTCYCGDEVITLERLLAFLESKKPFWRKADGTLVEISNRRELERLADLLASFHARETGGFEGRLHHAPELEYVMTSSPYYNSVRTKNLEQFLNHIHKGKPVEEIRIPARLENILRPYQKAGIDWLYFLRSYRFAGILADDMGLGKTLQALAILDLEKVPSRPSVVVCPKTLLYNWKLETEKFFPQFKVLVYDGNPKERLALSGEIGGYDLVVLSYSTLKQDEDLLSKFKFNYAVLDEAQFIKNHATKNAQTVKKLNADYRLALTGTPLENSVLELWSIYDFLMPGFLGSEKQFIRRFKKPIMEHGDRQALEHLRRKTESFMLRRTKTEVLKELPSKIEQLSLCRLSNDQNILYQQILAEVRGKVFEAVKIKGFQSAQIHILAGLTKLRQACNHPALLTKDKNWRTYQSAKLDACLELVEEVLESRRKVLIFSQFTKMLDIVSGALSDRSIAHVYLSGKSKNRQKIVEKFNTDPAVPVFLISLKAGGTGLNLTAADTVIIFDPWWNPSVENQAIDRAYRIGQTKTVNAYRLLTSGTIEEKIQALKVKKQGLFDAVVGESGSLFKKLTWDDVRELFAD